jgi:hypothetical protein
MGKATRRGRETELADGPTSPLHSSDDETQEEAWRLPDMAFSPRSTFEDDSTEPDPDAPHIHKQKAWLGHYWCGALVAQLMLYAVVYSCSLKASAVTVDLPGSSNVTVVDADDAEGADGVEQATPPGELLVQFVTFMCVAYQIREIPRHMNAGKDNEAEWVYSERLADRLKAIKRVQWHQRMCFAPQPLMVMGALIASMGAAVLLSKYADCNSGIMEGLVHLDSSGQGLLMMVLVSISLVIACFVMSTRIHFASFKFLTDSPGMQEFIDEMSHTPRGETLRIIESNSLRYWFLTSLGLQSLILLILSTGTSAAAESGVPGAESVSSTLFVVMGGGVFHLGCQTGALGDYYSQSKPLMRSDEYLSNKRVEWHHRNMFSPVLVAVLQSFVVFPSSLSLFPFFRREVRVPCRPVPSAEPAAQCF